MDILEFCDYCQSLPLSEETTPFDEDTLVYKIAGKMYVYTSISDFSWICLKCDPDRITELIESYGEISPARHSSKVHWLTVSVKGDLPDRFIKDLIRDSYYLVIRNMPRKKREEILRLVNGQQEG